MGADAQHVKLTVQDKNKVELQLLAFNARENWFAEPGDVVDVWFTPTMNEWNGRRAVEGRLLNLESSAKDR